jgi:hypothetical protein
VCNSLSTITLLSLTVLSQLRGMELVVSTEMGAVGVDNYMMDMYNKKQVTL